MSNVDLALVYVLLLIPLWISAAFALGRIREMLWAVVRMTAQLTLVGLYIEVLFRVESVWLNLLWVVAMLVVADLSSLKKSGIPARPLLVATVFLTLTPGILVPVAVLLRAVRPDPWYEARTLIPLVGMVLGNSLRGNIVALSRFREILTRERDLYASRLMVGATRAEALRPVYRASLQASLAPQLASIATIGLVSLPGMMTGQILGGALPLTAIRYQIAIMLTILAAVSLAALLNIAVASRLLLDDRDMPYDA